ncbi:ribosome-binding factor A [Candidatus Endolissoclinum faulkneri L2]|uniref:Ribosome-binding factor A n=1 Tax=Candidatus Endolissoclinum faulkneri L2 TaxID=1193729 RepID=K7YNT1_9PROT|nr:30S ribosome-binding factor RbfA [Candidatus Endolissoclinum faulkneri]AFX98279.1 ribosome-binding factor A [Candidatus Endolissoclinum faulkneri L2]
MLNNYNGQSYRQLRVGERIRRILSGILRNNKLYDPILFNLPPITLSEVCVSSDMRNATVWVIPSVNEHMEEILSVLKRASGRLSSQVAREVHMKFTPSLTFKRDTAFDSFQRMTEILQDPLIQQDIKNGTK